MRSMLGDDALRELRVTNDELRVEDGEGEGVRESRARE